VPSVVNFYHKEHEGFTKSTKLTIENLLQQKFFMKKLIPVIAFFIFSNSYAQMARPTKWTFTYEEKKDGEAELIFKVKIDEHWHIYSQNTPVGGPIPMSFTFEKPSGFILDGKVIEPKPVEEYDSSFEMNVLFFKEEVQFRQKIKLNKNSCTVKGKIEYQACKEACIFMDTTFSIKVQKGKSEKSELPVQLPFEGSIPADKSIIKRMELAVT
jgi:DsbC/DsbD-like thiol-disulfide interchange protein